MRIRIQMSSRKCPLQNVLVFSSSCGMSPDFGPETECPLQKSPLDKNVLSKNGLYGSVPEVPIRMFENKIQF